MNAGAIQIVFYIILSLCEGMGCGKMHVSEMTYRWHLLVNPSKLKVTKLVFIYLR